MRILHVFKTGLPESHGGTEQVVAQLCRGAVSHGWQPRLLTLSDQCDPETIIFNGYPVTRARRLCEIASMGVSLDVFAKFKHLAADSDVVHYHYPWPWMDVMHFAVRHGKPSVVTYHSDIVRQRRLLRLYQPLQDRFFGSVDRIVATSRNYLETSTVLARYVDKTSIIPLGIDPAAYPVPTEAQIAHWRERFGERFLLFVGVLRYYKGLQFLVDACKGLDIPVVIAGGGPMEHALRAQIKQLGLHNVHLLGVVEESDKVALLRLCRGFVFPSCLRSEAFGVSLLESSMYGKPMISCEIGTGTSFINLDGVTGIVVPPGDSGQLHDAMCRLAEDDVLATRMGQAARARFVEQFQAEQMVAHYHDLYRQLVESREGHP